MSELEDELAPPLIDRFGRAITYLRVSVTDRCDFRCTYCMAEDMTFVPRKELLALEEIDRLASAFIARGVRKVRLTGGEPLVRRNILWLIEALSRHLGDGLEELTLTTNGSLRRSSACSHAGVISIRSCAASMRRTAPGSRSRSTRWRCAT
jgi:cyclic pyranopterin phosphate synthase